MTNRTRSGRQLSSDLSTLLRAVDGSGYGRYKSATGDWDFDRFTLEVEKVQSDPYAPPTRLAAHVPQVEAGIPPELWKGPLRRRALGDYLARSASRRLRDTPFRVDSGSQEVLDRSACQIRDSGVALRLAVGLPAHGRRIDGKAARRLLCEELPKAVEASLLWEALDGEDVRAFVECVEDTCALRDSLPDHGLVAFVADGSILPRRSGVDDRPLSARGQETQQGDVVPFASPESLRVEIDLPNRGRVRGMGVPEGVTLVVGGGFHGKSTLLRSLERGVYDHVPGDGRELVVARTDTVKIRAEDGRRVERVDVSPFVGDLPTGADTSAFRTDNASGSTSQAASIAEGLEAGAGVLLLDEDTAATNLMIRDARMQQLVAKDKEPLTPFVDLVGPLHREHGVSTILVMGGSGDYFPVADHVVMMQAFRPADVTDRARELTGSSPGTTERHAEAATFPAIRHRVPAPASVRSQVGGKTKIKGRGIEALTFGDDVVDLRGVEQIVDSSQVVGIGLALARLVRAGYLDERATVACALDRLEEELAADGVEALRGGYAGDVALPRRFEIAAALNRLRTLAVTDFADSPDTGRTRRDHG